MTANGLFCTTVLTASNMYNCPAGAVQCRGLLAQIMLTMSMGAPTQAGLHSCMVTCNCPGGNQIFTISNADGLPVELLEFNIDDSGDSQGADNPETGDSTSNERTLVEP